MPVLRGAAAEPGAAPVTATAGMRNSAEQTAPHATTEVLHEGQG
ncbi:MULTISPECIES: hypothetical protein [unclassified Streptomyces]|jgi:hypothetical protein|nr:MULTISPECIES: hypothetical protein [unclassified Streptomyces]